MRKLIWSFFTFLLIFIFLFQCLSNTTHAKSKKSLFALSKTVAYDWGKAYQMQQNCKLKAINSSPQRAAGLFINYFNEQEVQEIMNNYASGMVSREGRNCNIKELKAFMPVLMKKISNYIKLATPHTR